MIAAGTEWKSFYNAIDCDKINNFATKHGMDWIVNKSADATWQNGCTERLIKSVKRCFSHIIGPNRLTFPELQTVYYECANILIERPIGIKDGNHGYFCPNDLISGRASIKVPAGKFGIDLNPRKRIKFIEKLTQDFWKRWHNHYFQSLVIQQKWDVGKRNLCKGDIVLVQDNKSFRGD